MSHCTVWCHCSHCRRVFKTMLPYRTLRPKSTMFPCLKPFTQRFSSYLPSPIFPQFYASTKTPGPHAISIPPGIAPSGASIKASSPIFVPTICQQHDYSGHPKFYPHCQGSKMWFQWNLRGSMLGIGDAERSLARIMRRKTETIRGGVVKFNILVYGSSRDSTEGEICCLESF